MSNDTIPQRTCTKCGAIYPATLEYWHRAKRGKYGLQSWCKPCRAECAYKYNDKHRDEQNERSRQYDAEHREKRLEYKRKHRARHRDEYNERTRQWQKDNPEKCRAKWHRHRAHKLAAEGSYTAEDMAAQYKRQRGKCYYCGCKLNGVYHDEHVIPLSRGGSNWPSNMVCACPVCNLSKNDKLPHEWPEGGRLL